MTFPCYRIYLSADKPNGDDDDVKKHPLCFMSLSSLFSSAAKTQLEQEFGLCGWKNESDVDSMRLRTCGVRVPRFMKRQQLHPLIKTMIIMISIQKERRMV
jgi:hypothetical protein